MSTARLAIAIAAVLTLSVGVATVAPACENPGKVHKLKFKVKGDECVEKVAKDDDDSDAEDVYVCVSDTVVWKVSGRAKSVVFDGDSPFDWSDSGFRGNSIEGVVREGTAGQSFKYSVKVDGLECVHDPRVVVEP